ncbi:MAG: alpha/beta fold hydrolase [Rhodocyclaceae bacterium]
MRALVGAVGLLAGAYGAACAYLWAFQRELIFEPAASVRRTPRDVGDDFEAVRIPVAAGGELQAWWLPAASTNAIQGETTILYLRGNDGNLGTEVDRLHALRRFGLPILAIGYRGYGESSGPAPCEAHLVEDAAAAWDFLTKVRGVSPQRVIVYGHSLGGAVAADLALRHADLCGVIFEAAFTSMAEGEREYPWFPIDWLLSERFEVLPKVGAIQAPALFIHGADDDLVPPSMAQRLFPAARGHKQLAVVPGAGHEEALAKGGAPLSESVARMVGRCAVAPRSVPPPAQTGSRP